MAELNSNNKPSAVVKIAADGDFILVVGPSEVKLRVHPLFLKAASKPFSAMLGPNWKESHNMLDWARAVELPLPKYDATEPSFTIGITQSLQRLPRATF